MNKNKPIVIAIDGPAASGKGTLAKKVAEYFGLKYLDTGSIYRATAYKIIESKKEQFRTHDNKSIINHIACNIKDEEATSFAKTIQIEDLKNQNLYNEGVGKIASIIAAIEPVRNALLNFQKDFAKSPEGAVLDGRDIGTVICPHADFKFYITANLETRAKRRYKQLQNKDNSIIYQSVLDDLQRRDERDSGREISPLAKADDAVAIDTTNMSVDEAFDKIVFSIEKSGARLKEIVSPA